MTEVYLAKARNTMKDMATSSLSKPNQVFSQVVATLNNDTRAVLPNPDTIKRTLRNHRRLNFSPDPTSLDDHVVDGSWAETAGDNPDDFLLYDNGPHDLLLETVSRKSVICRNVANGWQLFNGATSVPAAVCHSCSPWRNRHFRGLRVAN